MKHTFIKSFNCKSTKALSALVIVLTIAPIIQQVSAQQECIPCKNLADFPSPFVECGVLGATLVVGGTHNHGPYNWQAWTVDCSGSSGVASRLGLDAETGRTYQFIDTDVASYNATTDEVTVEWSIIQTHVMTVGGPAVNIFTLRYEQYCDVPFHVTGLPSSPAIHSKLTGLNYSSGYGYDHALLAIHHDADADGSKQVLVVYGVTGKGTLAACMVLQNHDAYLDLLQGTAVIIMWKDTNTNDLVDLGDSVSLVETWP